MKRLHLIYLFLVLLVLMHISHYYPHLPDRVASHFNAAGHPDGWLPKKALTAVYAGTVALSALTCLLLSVLMKHIPGSLINLPRKDYWLAPERIGATRDTISREVLIMGLGTTVFIIGVMHLVFIANLGSARSLPMTPFWLLLGGFCCFTLWWAASFIRRFSRTEEPAHRK
jgi:uncharacterized membrane protein